MRHRTQAVQGHPGARAWPRGPDGGAWGPQDLSPIPSERGFLPLVRGGEREKWKSTVGSSSAVVVVVGGGGAIASVV